MLWLWSLLYCSAVMLAFLAIATAYINWKHSYWSRRKVITSKPKFFFGNSKRIFLQLESFSDNLQTLYMELKNKGLRHFGYYMLLNPIWVILDIELIKIVLTKDFNYFTDRCIYANEKNDPLTGQVFMQKDIRWKNLRSKFTPIFTSGKIKSTLPLVLNCTKELHDVIDTLTIENQVVNIKDLVGKCTIDIIGSSVFGIECNSLKNPDPEFMRYGRMIFELNTIQAVKQFVAFTFPWIMDFLNLPLFPRKIINFFLETVRELVEYREKNNIIRNDFLHLLIQLKNNSLESVEEIHNNRKISNHNKPEILTMEELTAQLFIFFIGGFETTSTTIGFCFYELAQNLEIQEKLRKEVADVLKKCDGKITYESLKEMSYLDSCIQETLRKYPPLPILLRQCTENYKVPGSDVEIEKGTRVFIPILGIQRDPEFYPEPEVFNPDRFSNENKSKRPPVMLSFGEGPRNCIGQRFGMMQLKVVLATLLKSYKFSLNEKTPVPLVMDTRNFLLSPNHGIWLNVERVS